MQAAGWAILSQAQWDTTGLLLRLAGVTLVAVVLGVFFWRLYQRSQRNIESPSSEQEGLSLDSIQELHAQGELTDDEFRALRAEALARMGVVMDEQTEQPPSPSADENVDEDEDADDSSSDDEPTSKQ